MIFKKIICLFGKILFFSKKTRIKKKEINKIKKIAVIKSGAIGDVLMSTPFLRALRKRFPEVIIDYHIGKWSSAVLKNNPNISRIFKYDDSYFHSRNIKNKINLIKIIRKKKYDLVFILDKSWLANLLVFFTGIKYRIGFNRFGEGFANTKNVKYGPLKHEIDYYLDLAKIVGAFEKNKKLDLFISEKDRLNVKKMLNKINNPIAIIPGGAKNPGGGVIESRRWPEKKFTELIEKIPLKYTVLLLGGKSDLNYNNQILAKIKRKKVFNFAGKTTIHQSCELMRRCKYVVCNDSGPMHIASASGTKVISLFGPTNPKRKSPLTKGSIAIWKDRDIYDENIEIYGSEPKEKGYFKRINVENVLNVIKRIRY